MHKYSVVKKMPYTANQMFCLVKDVEKYPDFLPWCEGLRITDSSKNKIIADMLVGFNGISEKFTSQVIFDESVKTITVYYKDGPFKQLTNIWKFKDLKSECEVDFDINFSFKNRLLDITLKPIFYTVVKKMVGAFEQRAKQIY